MGTYIKLVLKTKTNDSAKKANKSLKKTGIQYEFYTDENLKESVDYINSPEGVDQRHQYNNGIATAEQFLTNWKCFVRLYQLIVKNNEDELDKLFNWIQTTGKKYVSLKESENLPFQKGFTPIKSCRYNSWINNPIRYSVKKHRELRGDVPLVRMAGKVYEITWDMYYQLP